MKELCFGENTLVLSFILFVFLQRGLSMWTSFISLSLIWTAQVEAEERMCRQLGPRSWKCLSGIKPGGKRRLL